MATVDITSEIVKRCDVPVILKNIDNWPLLKWSLNDWLENMPDDELPFRCKPPKSSSEPYWERRCPVKKMSLKSFFDAAEKNPEEWGYFDYKYVHQWLKPDNNIYKQIKWDRYGFEERDATQTTMWIGSNGAHTPCHQDTYGRNIVLQVYGKKRWLLFPPESGNLQPTRVPYEESSVYSQLNFFSPKDLSYFKRIKGCRMVVLEPGDALVVPPKWWHYVEHVSPIGISLNTWIPCDKTDRESQVEEALIRLLVAQLSKDLPQNLSFQILNPNEDDLVDLPLTVAILQVDTTVKRCVEYRSKNQGAKRIKLDIEKTPSNSKESIVDINKIIDECSNASFVKEITGEELTILLKENVDRNDVMDSADSTDETSAEDEDNDNDDHLTRAIINSFCDPEVIKIVKNNLIHHFS